MSDMAASAKENPGISSRRIKLEILIVLGITFGMSGLRSLLRLIDDLLSPVALNEQSVALNTSLANSAWLDLALQLCSAGVLFGWGALAIYLLGQSFRGIQGRDVGWGMGLAALIGIPGLIFYASAVHVGFSKEVVPTTLESWWEIPVLLVWSAANAFGEEIVVVLWLSTRLRQLRWSIPWIIVASAVLRGSYHLYQGVSAGFGNIIMGVVFAYFYQRSGKVWPLVIAHFLIDAVAFVGYSAIGGNLSWLGL
ncbi:CPBP family intramembrane glutamic endopeptidase [Corynebacterium callunae]|uniref:CPBP family intramembrane glutamic endopeptidase n=1 Tax=Corynebacterium callunae TaxID=1721 RepID=UPI001FFF54CD|nr:CPBP family intramembrane glutamic endopeptidase [Corynebacterium callunae]MCK2199849.1 CPBP family intramembrane metalloprotease [Corynebacterium callunae]